MFFSRTKSYVFPQTFGVLQIYIPPIIVLELWIQFDGVKLPIRMILKSIYYQNLFCPFCSALSVSATLTTLPQHKTEFSPRLVKFNLLSVFHFA